MDERMFTRDQVVEHLNALGIPVTERQVRSWIYYGLIPKPVIRTPPGERTGRGTVRALFTKEQVDMIAQVARNRGVWDVSSKRLGRLATFLLEHYPGEFSEEGDDEDAIDVAIRLLSRG